LFRYIISMKKIFTFENFSISENENSPRYTENEIENLLENFDGARFFKVNLKETDVQFAYPAKLRARENYKNGERGQLEFYISDVIYDIETDFIKEIKNRFDALGKSGEDLDDIMSDLDKIGFSEGKNATWSQIESAIKSVIKDASPGFVKVEIADFKFAIEAEQEGTYVNLAIVIDGFSGNIEFDSQYFADDILTELFYKK